MQTRSALNSKLLEWTLFGTTLLVGTFAWFTNSLALEMITALSLFCLAAMTIPKIAGRTVWYTGLASLLIGTFASVAASKYYWGYWFFRPTISSELTASPKVLTFTSFRADELLLNQSAKLRILPNTLLDLVHLYDSSDYDTPWARATALLFHQKRLDAQTPLPNEKVIKQLEALLNENQLPMVDPGKTGYEKTAHNFRGSIIEFLNEHDERRFYISLGGGQVSNDHYGYYEILFASDAAGNLGAVIEKKKFYYDIAGIEGFEWMILAPFLTLIMWLVSLPIALIFRKLTAKPPFPPAQPQVA